MKRVHTTVRTSDRFVHCACILHVKYYIIRSPNYSLFIVDKGFVDRLQSDGKKETIPIESYKKTCPFFDCFKKALKPRERAESVVLQYSPV